MSYIVKRKVRKYRKKFVIPVLTSNGTMGGDSFAVDCSTPKDNVYEIFNAGADGTKAVDTNPNAAPQWVRFYNPVPLKVTKFRLGQIKNTAEQNNYYITAWKIQASDDKETWVDVWSGTGSKPAKTLTANIESSGYHKYYRVYVTSAPYYSGYPRVFFCGIDFEAEAEDAIYPVYSLKSYAIKKKEKFTGRIYGYLSKIKAFVPAPPKPEYVDYIQPILTSNGTMGGDSFACAASGETDMGMGAGSEYAYHAFDNDKSSIWLHSGVSSGKYISWYMSEAPLVTKITIVDNSITNGSFYLECSDDGTEWIRLAELTGTSNSSTVIKELVQPMSKKYWRLYDPRTSWVMWSIVQIEITAQEKI